MIGRIGSILGEADVNISAMHLARSAPRSDAVMILALDDEVPAAVGGRDPRRSTASSTCGSSTSEPSR